MSSEPNEEPVPDDGLICRERGCRSPLEAHTVEMASRRLAEWSKPKDSTRRP